MILTCPIAFDYHFIYVNGTKEAEWILEDDIQLEAKKTLTVWIQN